MTATIIAVTMMVQVMTIAGFAVSTNKFSEEISFLAEKGFFVDNILEQEELENGVKFYVNYLPNDEISYITYTQENDGVKVVVTEGSRQNEIVYKSNGTIFLDGERNETLEMSYLNENVTPFAVFAVSNYENYSDVPGRNYWNTQTFKSTVSLTEKKINYTADMTVNALSLLVVGAYSLPTGFVGFVAGMCIWALNRLATSGLESAILHTKSTRYYMHNPMTLQYLYRIGTAATVSGQNYAGETFYRLESYN